MPSLGASFLTVTTPARSYDLADLATLKDDLGVTDDAADEFLQRTITRASSAVQNFCNRTFVVEGVSEQFWPPRDGWPWTVTKDTQPLQLTRWPIVAVASVIETIAGVATPLVAGTDYLLDAGKGQLIRLDDFGYPQLWRPNPIAVVYTAGYAQIPDDIVDAVTRLVKAARFAQTRDPALKSETMPGVYSASYAAPTAGSSGMPADVVDLIDNYRQGVFA